jgi:hypothetical protein
VTITEVYSVENLVKELGRVTDDDKGTVERRLSSDPRLSEIYLTPAGIEQLQLTPPQKAWLCFTQATRQHARMLQLTYPITTLEHTFRAAATAGLPWLTEGSEPFRAVTLPGRLFRWDRDSTASAWAHTADFTVVGRTFHSRETQTVTLAGAKLVTSKLTFQQYWLHPPQRGEAAFQPGLKSVELQYLPTAILEKLGGALEEQDRDFHWEIRRILADREGCEHATRAIYEKDMPEGPFTEVVFDGRAMRARAGDTRLSLGDDERLNLEHANGRIVHLPFFALTPAVAGALAAALAQCPGHPAAAAVSAMVERFAELDLLWQRIRDGAVGELPKAMLDGLVRARSS